ncbi:MAG: hypothetical protein ACLQG5_12980 [Methanobacterium sp.]|jgi:hypothetical protein
MSKNSDRKFPATVVKVLNSYEVAINRGSEDGVREGQMFAIFGFSDEKIIDPESGEDLGLLEIFKGDGEVINVQERMSTIRSARKKPDRKEVIYEDTNDTPYFLRTISNVKPSKRREITTVGESLPFNNPKRDDKAKPI